MHFVLLGVLLGVGPQALLSPGKSGSHEAWMREIRLADEHAIESAMRAFDRYVHEHPKDVGAAIERCKLIGAVTSREDEEPPKGFPSFEDCLSGLESFSDSAVAISYRIEVKWGDGLVAFATEALSNPRISWTDGDRAHVHARLAHVEQGRGRLEPASRFAKTAMTLDPSIDLTSTVAAQLLVEGRKTEAIVALSSRPDGSPIQLQQKASQLAEAGSFLRAQWMLGLARARSGFHGDPMLQARIFEGTGRLDEARKAYAAQSGAWNKSEVLSRLFKLEVAGSDRALAARAYQALRDQGWNADPLARRRLALFRKFPSAAWQTRDLLGIAAFLGCLIGLAFLPAFLALPVHSWTLWHRLRQPRPEHDAPAIPEWWFRHLYIAMALPLIAQFLVMYVVAYEELAIWIAPNKQVPAVAPSVAAFGLWYAVLVSVAVGVLLVHRPQRLRLLGPGSWTVRKCIGQALVAQVLTFTVGILNAQLMRAGGVAAAAITIENMIRSMVGVYGIPLTFLAISILIPVVEELLFRSILLDVFRRHMPFWVANAVQALAFALLHVDLAHLIYYVAMGLLAGRLRRASGGLLACILFHGTNNTLVLLLIAATGSNLPAKKIMPASPDGELVACAQAARARGVGRPLRAAGLAASLNNLAWDIAIDPKATPSCLLKADEGMDAALKQAPESPTWLDTKATLLFREGRLDEAIDLERAAADLSQKPFHLSQLERFLRARQQGKAPIQLGKAALSVSVSLVPQAAGGGTDLVVEMDGDAPDGLVFYARGASEGGLLQFSAGRGHARSYRLPLPATARNETGFEVSLTDARGCEGCIAGQLRYRFGVRDADVDHYP
jgi:membrane protease YdiL (CAAX protease family)